MGGEGTYAGFNLRTSDMNSALNVHSHTHARTERSQGVGEKESLRDSTCQRQHVSTNTFHPVLNAKILLLLFGMQGTNVFLHYFSFIRMPVYQLACQGSSDNDSNTPLFITFDIWFEIILWV